MVKLINLLGLFFLASTVLAHPQIEINKTKINIEEMYQGDILVDHSLVISNKGNKDLSIEIPSLCDCLIIAPNKFVLKPGKKIAVDIQWDTKEEEEKDEKIFYILSNDPENNVISIHLQVPQDLKNKINIQSINSEKSITSNQARMHFFYSVGCKKCRELLKTFFPSLKDKAGNPVPLYLHDLNKKAEFELLLKFRSHGGKNSVVTPVVIYGQHYIAGLDNIKNQVPEIIQDTQKPKNTKIKQGSIVLPSLSLFTIMVAGLIDGINPCAFATIIFLLSYFTYLKKSKKIIFITGVFYITAVYSTYFIIGLGLFAGIKSLAFFGLISKYINFVMALFCFLLVYFSIQDLFFALKGEFHKMKLQLTLKMKQKIHQNIRREMNSSLIILAAITMGIIVSFFELACTGQIYLPTILYLIKTTQRGGYFYLMLYNLMFILPLLLIFSLYYFGISSKRIGQFLNKRIVFVKILMIILFLSLGLFLLIS